MSETALTADVTVMTHQGALRDHNEDAALVGRTVFSRVSMAEPEVLRLDLSRGRPVVVAIADGLGGHAAGEVAAGHAVQRLARPSTGPSTREAVAASLCAISDEIAELGRQDDGCRDMGTTVVGLLITDEETIWFNVGDSRAYVLLDGYLGQLSVDDSPFAPVEPGAQPETGAVVTQVLGAGIGPLRPHTGVLKTCADAYAESVYLLCSDGLSDLVEVDEIERLLEARAEDDRAAVKSLWAAAMNRGGRDNITVALVRLSTVRTIGSKSTDSTASRVNSVMSGG